MARIQKGFALSVAVLGLLSLIFGMGLAIASWVLTSRFKDVEIMSQDDDSGKTIGANIKHFSAYWWGGLFYCIPGILGIIAACSKNICVMVFFMVFNILCLICSVVASAVVAVALVLWSVVNGLLTNGGCDYKSVSRCCQCTPTVGNILYINNVSSCTEMKSASSLLGGILAMAALLSLIAFISSYVSCCSLCHQESQQNGTIIIEPGNGLYRPPPNMFATPSAPQHQYAPPHYTDAPHTQTNDTDSLIKNEVV